MQPRGAIWRTPFRMQPLEVKAAEVLTVLKMPVPEALKA